MVKRDKLGRFVKGSTFYHSEQTKRKIGLGNSKPNPKVGKILKKLYKEGKLKINNIFKKGHKGYTFWKGKKLLEEHKRKISKANKGKISWMEGKHHTKETIEKLRKASLGQKHSKESIEKYKKWRKTFVLPKKDTKIEVKIQNFLKKLGIEFFTHQYIKIEHGYQCDILIPIMNLVIECDGDYWHKYPVGLDIDKVRTSELIEKGFKVLRLWEFEIKEMSIGDFKKSLNRQRH